MQIINLLSATTYINDFFNGMKAFLVTRYRKNIAGKNQINLIFFMKKSIFQKCDQFSLMGINFFTKICFFFSVIIRGFFSIL